MPRNASGVYSLPVAAYVAGTTIRSADMNSNLSDIGTALTQSLATTGVSSMTGPIKNADGSVSAPAITYAADPDTGWYRSGSGTSVYVADGTPVITLAAAGVTVTNMTVTNLTVTGTFTVASARVVGEMVDYGGTVAPSLWLLCYGQAISRATYASLFAVISTAFGPGDGVSTFNVPDLRGRATFGKDDMGGSAANRITAGGSGITGTTLGASGGAQTHTLVIGEIPAHSHTVTDPQHNHTAKQTTGNNVTANTSSMSVALAEINSVTGNSSTGITNQNTGGGGAHNNMPPALIVNKMIYAAV